MPQDALTLSVCSYSVMGREDTKKNKEVLNPSDEEVLNSSPKAFEFTFAHLFTISNNGAVL